MKNVKHICTGLLAHVDAGKTTCVEAMLLNSGTIRRAGRVDHGDTILDYDEQERSHGITIYAKEAHMKWMDAEIDLIDTPGHVDFSAEMERSLSVLDLAVLLINGQDGVQAHTHTIWKCLSHYNVPCIIFVNKMDISFHSREELLTDLKTHCSDMCVSWDEDRDDTLAMANDEILEAVSETGSIPDELLQQAFMKRQFFPVLFGSALKNQGVDTLMNLMCQLVPKREYPEAFGAKVFRISTDPQGNRLTHMRITGGVLHARDRLNEEDKADQIRRYNGLRYDLLMEAGGGEVVCIKGISSLEAGAGLGFEKDSSASILNASMTYQLELPEGASPLVLADTCATLASEDPRLEISTDERTGRIVVTVISCISDCSSTIRIVDT